MRSAHRTNESRLARAVAAGSPLSYQQALDAVRAAAAAGALPRGLTRPHPAAVAVVLAHTPAARATLDLATPLLLGATATGEDLWVEFKSLRLHTGVFGEHRQRVEDLVVADLRRRGMSGQVISWPEPVALTPRRFGLAPSGSSGLSYTLAELTGRSWPFDQALALRWSLPPDAAHGDHEQEFAFRDAFDKMLERGAPATGMDLVTALRAQAAATRPHRGAAPLSTDLADRLTTLLAHRKPLRSQRLPDVIDASVDPLTGTSAALRAVHWDNQPGPARAPSYLVLRDAHNAPAELVRHVLGRARAAGTLVVLTAESSTAFETQESMVCNNIGTLVTKTPGGWQLDSDTGPTPFAPATR